MVTLVCIHQIPVKYEQLPHMSYGLEVSSFRQVDVCTLDTVQEGILRRIQCLSDRTANVAVYGLLGMCPIEQKLDARKSSPLALHEIALRQLAVKDTHEHSWFMQCNTFLHKYDFSNIFRIRDAFASNGTYRKAIKRGWTSM